MSWKELLLSSARFDYSSRAARERTCRDDYGGRVLAENGFVWTPSIMSFTYIS